MQRRRIPFTPVRLKTRHDGCTPVRQSRFIEELAATKSLTRACKAVGMSRMSAYKLRSRPDAAELRSAWDKALQPDFAIEPARSPHALRRHRRVEQPGKVDEVHETDGSPISHAPALSTLSALQTLETCVRLLRAEDQELRSAPGE
jgi:hypothetical protein